jgi:hypothetical protein
LGNAIDAEPEFALSRMLCQQTVHDVVAHLPVNDVAAPVNYGLKRGVGIRLIRVAGEAANVDLFE